ncbi:MAG TPA: amidohydrolase family protein [Bryobacteraceae bacterium]|nr:amidohydrolase family protein [Bryobacteraceae bacterium]
MKASLQRREFLLAGMARLSDGASAPLDLSTIPNFCTHEHWGSIDSIGRTPEGFRADVERGAVPHGNTGVLDLLLEPYFLGLLNRAGAKISVAELKRRSTFQALRSLRPVLDPQRFTGTYQCTRRGLLHLYGIDIANPSEADCVRLDREIDRHYRRFPAWYREVMGKAHFSGVIRPVHPEFYVRQDSAAAAAGEREFLRTLMRIDPLIDLWRDPARRKRLAEIAGIEPRDAPSWRRFIGNLFDLAARNGALGTKQLQAYTRDLNFLPRSDTEVAWPGELTRDQVRAFQDWVVQECSRQANDRGWPHQVHVGTTNLPYSNPLPLEALAKRYPRMKIVMIHCWPYLNEAGWLAKYRANMYIDTCWQPVLSPGFFRDAARLWLTYVPANKITCGHDATTIEMAVGSSLYVREILAGVLRERSSDMGATSRDLLRVATGWLNNNAIEIYGLGKAA